jgi:HTH-type transcriptional regulator, transcriptional repressor of NAD biosynthesis genes
VELRLARCPGTRLELADREDAAAQKANRGLICDTNAFATVLGHRRYMGTRSKCLEEMAGKGRCDLYPLTGDEIPFIQEGLRDGEHIRHEMHTWLEKALAEQSVPWILVRGTPEQRLARAVEAVGGLFKESSWHPVPVHMQLTG